MPDLHSPIELLCPPRIEFGAGTLSAIRPWVEERGCKRILVVADPFNAGAWTCWACPAPSPSSAR